MGQADDAGRYTATLVSFGRALRAHDVPVSLAELNEAARALTLIDPLDRTAFYHAVKATLLNDIEDEETFDRLFDEFWADPRDGAESVDAPDERADIDLEGREPEAEPTTDEDLQAVGRAASGVSPSAGPPETELEADPERSGGGGSNRADVEAADQQVAFDLGRNQRAERLHPPAAAPRDAERLSLLVTELGRQLGTVRGFESRPHPTGDVDLRRSFGVRERSPADFPRLEKRETLARVVLFVDVSRSMLRNLDQDFLFRFLFECIQQFTDVRLFFFDTNVREVTDHFEAANIERMRAALSAAEAEWGAGTTIGACLAAIRTRDPFVVDYNTHCLVVSDGWDAGDLDVLEREMTALSRRARSVIWLNPPASSAAYTPEVSGMKTALPYVDRFAGFASIDDLESFVEDLRTAP